MARATHHAALLTLLLGMGGFGGAACSGEPASSAGGAIDADVRRPAAKIEVLSRKRALANYPCQQCHQHVRDEESAPSKAHTQIRMVHMEGGDYCQTCHDPTNPEELRLATGKSFGLDDVHGLCGQCHSTQVADWEVGIHGKQVGNWLTKIQRYSCTACHDPHTPAVPPEISIPAPPRSRFGIPKGNH